MVLHDRMAGALLGVAIGDVIGLPFEGLSMKRVGRRFRHAQRFRLVGRTGFVSDDTEQTVLVGQALAFGGAEHAECLRLFRRSMVGWLARLPFGIGGATLRACMRMAIGHPAPGVRSAGNGAAMRAGILGAHLASDPTRRRRLGRGFAVLTHTDSRAIEAALYVAEVTANAVISPASTDPATMVEPSRVVLHEPQLTGAVDRALELGMANAPLADAVRELGNSGFVVHSVGLCTYCFARYGAEPTAAIEAATRAGGDTDTHAAIVGGWAGALHGASRLPSRLVSRLQRGPFGAAHLRGLAAGLIEGTPPPAWSWAHALLRNLALCPVILSHGFARLVPW